MRGAVAVAIAAAFGNLLQGWDNAAIAGFSIFIHLIMFSSPPPGNSFFFFFPILSPGHLSFFLL